MNQLLSYIFQVIIASAILYFYYHLALRNRKFHQYNRFYLLIALVISVLVPFLNIPVYFTREESESSFVLQTLASISSDTDAVHEASTGTENLAPASSFDPVNLLYYFYVLLVVLILARISFSLLKIRRIIRSYATKYLGSIKFVNTDEPGTPYSFFNWLFWNKNIELRSEKGEQVFRHELFHIQQKHSLDLLFTELLTAIFWINPFFHLIKKELRAVHEFLADQFAVNENQKWEYAELLLMEAFKTRHNLVNPFFHNQIKRRIAMITNPKKTSHRYLRKLLVLPVIALVLTLFAFKYRQNNSNDINKAEAPITVVIDAGHGGTDPGVISQDGRINEAAISLELSKAIQRLAPEYNVNVIMTRENSNFPGNVTSKDEGLRKRLQIVNDVKPDAFISLHLDAAATDNKNSGFRIITSPKKEDKNSLLLASALVGQLSTIHKTQQQVHKTNEAGIYVLDNSSFPSVILECGYLSDPADLAFITSKDSQEKLARSILEAVVKFNDALLSDMEMQINKGFNNKLVIINGEKMNKNSLQSFKNAMQKGGSMSIESEELEPAEAVKKYGADAKNGVLEITMEPENLLDHITEDTLQPLVIVDGKELPVGSTKEILDQLPPAQISSINVYKGQQAIDIYGEKGKNGVIIITTKTSLTLTDVEVKTQNNEKIFKTEIDPAFPGGENKWREHAKKVMDPDVPAKNGAPAEAFTVTAEFIVHKNGTVSDIKILNKAGYGMEEELIKAIKSARWLPGIQNGREVNAYKRTSWKFVVEKAELKKFSGDNKGTSNLSIEQRVQDVEEIKKIARNKEQVVYVHKGRTYVFSNSEATSFAELDGTLHTFLINGQLITTSMEEVNSKIKRQRVTRLRMLRIDEVKQNFPVKGKVISIETRDPLTVKKWEWTLYKNKKEGC